MHMERAIVGEADLRLVSCMVRSGTVGSARLVTILGATSVHTLGGSEVNIRVVTQSVLTALDWIVPWLLLCTSKIRAFSRVASHGPEVRIIRRSGLFVR